jgi:hypothetical protein
MMYLFALVIALIPVYQVIVEDLAAGYELVPAEIV